MSNKHAAGSLLAVAALAAAVVGCGQGTTPLSHRDFLRAVDAEYYSVQDPQGSQALDTPARMTAQLAAFIASVTRLRPADDELDVRAAIVKAAQDEVTALCEMPATRADALSDMHNLDAHCSTPRPQYRSMDSATAALTAARALHDAVDQVPQQ